MKHRNNIIIVLVLLLIISIGFSVLSSNLNIIGNSLVKSNSWDIHFENVQVKEGSVNAPTPQINASGNQVTFNITLNNIDDYYEFYVDVVNDGTIDGMIDTYTLSQLTSEQQRYLDFYVKYKNGIELEQNQMVKTNQSVTYKVYVGYKKNMDSEDLPDADANNINLSLEVNYVQSNENGVEIPNELKLVFHRYGYNPSTGKFDVPAYLIKSYLTQKSCIDNDLAIMNCERTNVTDLDIDSYTEFVSDNLQTLKQAQLISYTSYNEDEYISNSLFKNPSVDKSYGLYMIKNPESYNGEKNYEDMYEFHKIYNKEDENYEYTYELDDNYFNKLFQYSKNGEVHIYPVP